MPETFNIQERSELTRQQRHEAFQTFLNIADYKSNRG